MPLRIDGLVNVQQDTLEQLARNLFAKTIPVILVELVLNFPEVVIFAYVQWENTAIIANTVSSKLMSFARYEFEMNVIISLLFIPHQYRSRC